MRKDMLNSLQTKLLEMLKWFDEYCTEHSIRYYAAGGTLLGAVRHGGFIPWDDDIDLILPRPDYERLLSLLSEQDGKYILEAPSSKNKDYLYSYAKLYDTTTTLIEHTRYNCKRGVYVDIFPLDGAGNGEEECRKHFSKVDRWNMFLMTRTCAVRKGRSLYKNISIVFSRLIPGFIVNNKRLALKVDRLASECRYEDSKYVANFMGAYRSKEIMEKSVLGEPIRYPFENIYINGAEHCDEYLTHIYGDWRSLPPVEKQVSHHDYVELDLERSYLSDKRTNGKTESL